MAGNQALSLIMLGGSDIAEGDLQKAALTLIEMAERAGEPEAASELLEMIGYIGA